MDKRMKTQIVKQLIGGAIGLAFAASVSPSLKAKMTIQELFQREGIHFNFKAKSPDAGNKIDEVKPK